jgi:hypothetical protein
MYDIARYGVTKLSGKRGNSMMTKMTAAPADERNGGIIAFRASADLLVSIEAAAASEGISRSDIARRALIRDLRAREEVRP